MEELNDTELKQKINLETGKLTWQELQRHFARGVVVVIDPTLDLVEVAHSFARDDKEKVQHWADNGQLHRASDADALEWQEENSAFWSVVVSPWILVQPITQH